MYWFVNTFTFVCFCIFGSKLHTEIYRIMSIWAFQKNRAFQFLENLYFYNAKLENIFAMPIWGSADL